MNITSTSRNTGLGKSDELMLSYLATGRKEIKMITPIEWKFILREDAESILNEHGIHLSADDIRNCEFCEAMGCIYYITVADETEWELNIETGKRRHKGLEVGCFWTEWR